MTLVEWKRKLNAQAILNTHSSARNGEREEGEEGEGRGKE